MIMSSVLDVVRSRIVGSGDGITLTSMDALTLLELLPAGTADIVFLDPPFNLGKAYGEATSPELDSAVRYEAYMIKMIQESARVLAAGGALYLYHLPYWASRLSSVLLEALDFRHWIAVSMKNGFARGMKLYPAHYALLYYTKGEPASFHRPRLQPIVCRKCGATLRDYGGYRDVIDEKGINLGDVWDDLSPVRHQSKKNREGNELPKMLTDRIVEISGIAGGILLDPFVGSGTALLSGREAGLVCLGNDLDPEAIRATIDRLRRSGIELFEHTPAAAI
jgi:site-specific DNA-methyltransferase (adenine-specific)